jgi:hypothetical protein
MKTIKDFTSQSHIDASIIRAVIRQMGGWSEFKDDAKNVVDHGAAGGYGQFIYYTDTVAFYARNRAAINRMAGELAENIGDGGIIECVQGFNCLNGEYTADEVGAALYGTKSCMNTQIANALAWFALEEVARSYMDLTTDGGY